MIHLSELLAVIALWYLIFHRRRIPQVGLTLVDSIRAFKKGLGGDGETKEREVREYRGPQS